MTLDLSTLYSATEQAKLADLPHYETAALVQVPPGADVTLTGKAPVWLYLRVARALHGHVRSLNYDSPVTGPVEVFPPSYPALLLPRRLVEAIEFAAMKHSNKTRKGNKLTSVPYVAHPFAVAMLLQRAGFEDDVVIAGLLHDTMEDAGVTSAELQDRFGTRVARIVEGCSEPDKSLEWEVRKRHTLEMLPTASWEVRAAACADKLHNAQSMRAAYAVLGEACWNDFKRGRNPQAWYFRGILEALDKAPPCPLLTPLLDCFRREVAALFPETPNPVQ